MDYSEFSSLLSTISAKVNLDKEAIQSLVNLKTEIKRLDSLEYNDKASKIYDVYVVDATTLEPLEITRGVDEWTAERSIEEWANGNRNGNRKPIYVGKLLRID